MYERPAGHTLSLTQCGKYATLRRRGASSESVVADLHSGTRDTCRDGEERAPSSERAGLRAACVRPASQKLTQWGKYATLHRRGAFSESATSDLLGGAARSCSVVEKRQLDILQVRMGCPPIAPVTTTPRGHPRRPFRA